MNAAELAVRKLHKSFRSGKTQSVAYRKEQLRKLYDLLTDDKDLLLNAVQEDLRKPHNECTISEIEVTKNDICEALNNLDEWVKPEYVPKKLANKAKTVYNIHEPLGVSLIISAWNYPVALALQPLVGAISAGNCAVIKPSELSANTADVLEVLVKKYLDQECYTVMQGGVEETTALLKCRFDHILYTGSTAVGKIVMKAAAENLTKVTLELGGKSPCYVAEDSDLSVVARRISWGKFLNSGQTCIAPDYVLCPRNIQDELVSEIKKTAKEFYGETPNTSPDYGRIVNIRHFNRVKKLLDSGHVAFGGDLDEDDRYISPTVLVDVTPSDSIMQEEIFGPVLPIINVDDVDEAIDFINCREKPLALYAFSKNKRTLEKIAARTSSGAFHANDTMLHAAVDHLPFGGVGNSGTGCYHGKFSFEEFSHKKPVLIAGQNLESLNTIRYPPYSEKKTTYIKMLLGKKINPSPGSLWYIPYFVFGVLVSFVMKILGLPRYFLS